MENPYRQNPECALLSKEWRIINEYAWKLRKMQGETLNFGLKMQVPDKFHEEVLERVIFLQRKHGIIKGE